MKKQLLIVFVLLCVLFCGSGCSTVLYCSFQVQGREAREQTNQLPFGNIARGDMAVWEDTWSREDDVVPNWIHRPLNTLLVHIDLPISLAFDIVTIPYQLYIHKTLHDRKSHGD